jgi:hypothetical protein
MDIYDLAEIFTRTGTPNEQAEFLELVDDNKRELENYIQHNLIGEL